MNAEDKLSADTKIGEFDNSRLERFQRALSYGYDTK
jgi:hypothetical protein